MLFSEMDSLLATKFFSTTESKNCEYVCGFIFLNSLVCLHKIFPKNKNYRKMSLYIFIYIYPKYPTDQAIIRQSHKEACVIYFLQIMTRDGFWYGNEMSFWERKVLHKIYVVTSSGVSLGRRIQWPDGKWQNRNGQIT